MAHAVPLPPVDEHSDEETLHPSSGRPHADPAVLAELRQTRRARADRIAAMTPDRPQTSSVELLRQDRAR